MTKQQLWVDSCDVKLGDRVLRYLYLGQEYELSVAATVLVILPQRGLSLTSSWFGPAGEFRYKRDELNVRWFVERDAPEYANREMAERLRAFLLNLI